MSSDLISERPDLTEMDLGGDAQTVLASPRIAPAPATLAEARNAPGRAERIAALTRRIEEARIDPRFQAVFDWFVRGAAPLG